MELLLLIVGIFILVGVIYILYKLNSSQEIKDDPNQKIAEMNQMKEILTLEFKNLANEIFDEKTKKISEVNKENLSNILEPLKENIEKFERKVESSNKDALEFNAILKSRMKISSGSSSRIENLRNESLQNWSISIIWLSISPGKSSSPTS